SSIATWQPIGGSYGQVSINRGNNVWGINSGQIWQYRSGNWFQIYQALAVSIGVGTDGTVWVKVDGALVQISVGDKNHVWGVSRQNEIFYRTNGDINGTWVRVAGALKQVSVAADGTVWGVNNNGAIFRWNGALWELIPGNLTQIDVSCASYIIGTSSSYDIYQYRRRSWFKYDDGSLAYVSISVDGIIWGVDANGHIYTRQDGGFDGPAFK
ncbi:25879_t:CDS:2, partial [Gigaspora rosea]